VILFSSTPENGDAIGTKSFHLDSRGILVWSFLNALEELHNTFCLKKWTWKDLFYNIRFKLAGEDFPHFFHIDYSKEGQIDQPIHI
jgi:hypothetical protein